MFKGLRFAVFAALVGLLAMGGVRTADAQPAPNAPPAAPAPRTAGAFVPISLMTLVPNVLVVSPKLNVKTLQEFVELVKANPGKYNYASTGNGTGVVA